MAVEGPRGIRQEERASLIDLADRVFRGGGPGSMADDYPLLYSPDNLENLRVFCDDGKAVAHVGTLFREVCLGSSRHLACLIGSVCCDPDYREQGLATRLLEDCRARALDAGADLFLISGGRGLYRRIGYVDAGYYVSFTVSRDQVPEAGGLRLRPIAEADLPAANAIHAREPVRFVRTPDDLAVFLATGKVANRRGGIVLVCAGDSADPLAYIAYQVGGPPWEKRPDNAVTIAEVAGPRWAVACALGQLMDERGVGDLLWHCLGTDAEAATLAASLGWTRQERGFHGTAGIIAPELFWDRCRAGFGEVLGADAEGLSLAADRDGVSISLGPEKVTLPGMSDFTRLALLPPSRRSDLDPGLGAGSRLAQVLDRILPVPLVDYGLDYI